MFFLSLTSLRGTQMTPLCFLSLTSLRGTQMTSLCAVAWQRRTARAATDCSGNHQFNCTNTRCIPSEFLCDGDNDCSDNTDEQNCSESSCLLPIVLLIMEYICSSFYLCVCTVPSGVDWALKRNYISVCLSVCLSVFLGLHKNYSSLPIKLKLSTLTHQCSAQHTLFQIVSAFVN